MAGVSGVVSHASVVTLKVRVSPPKVTVTEATVPHVEAAVTELFLVEIGRVHAIVRADFHQHAAHAIAAESILDDD